MQKNCNHRHLTKHNHDKKFTCCPPKNAFPGTLLKIPDLDIDKKFKKIKTNVFLLMVSAFYKSNLQ